MGHLDKMSPRITVPKGTQSKMPSSRNTVADKPNNVTKCMNMVLYHLVFPKSHPIFYLGNYSPKDRGLKGCSFSKVMIAFLIIHLKFLCLVCVINWYVSGILNKRKDNHSLMKLNVYSLSWKIHEDY